MKLIFQFSKLVTGLLLTVILLSGCISSPPRDNALTIIIDRQEGVITTEMQPGKGIDFGKTRPGREFKRTVIFDNRLAREVRIDGWESTPGRMLLVPDLDSIPVKKQVRGAVVLKTGSFRGKVNRTWVHA